MDTLLSFFSLNVIINFSERSNRTNLHDVWRYSHWMFFADSYVQNWLNYKGTTVMSFHCTTVFWRKKAIQITCCITCIYLKRSVDSVNLNSGTNYNDFRLWLHSTVPEEKDGGKRFINSCSRQFLCPYLVQTNIWTFGYNTTHWSVKCLIVLLIK